MFQYIHVHVVQLAVIEHLESATQRFNGAHVLHKSLTHCMKPPIGTPVLDITASIADNLFPESSQNCVFWA